MSVSEFSGTDGAEDVEDGFEEEKKDEKTVTATKKAAAVLASCSPIEPVPRSAKGTKSDFTSYLVLEFGRSWIFPRFEISV